MALLLLLLAQDGNRLAYLDENNPYYPDGRFARLETRQWVGEEGVEAVLTLGIDDMRDSARYEAYLRPILDRLKKIDGRAPVSIMSCRVDPADERLQGWLKEGLSLECHTYDHPCPLLKDKDFAKAKATYDRCVDLLASVPSNRPVAFRVPCCDSLNTPSPRLYREIVESVTEKGRFLPIDSSVFCVLPDERFRKYLPAGRSFVNTIEDYPYPYVMGRFTWQFPCMTPSDWAAQHLHKPNNPATVEDWKAALDVVVRKQGVFNLVFHPHNWIKPEQVVELVDHAASKKAKILTFRECLERLEKNLLRGASLRRPDGGDAGVRLIDLDDDGLMDVIHAPARQTRRWNGAGWTSGTFPLDSLQGARFGILGGEVILLHDDGAWRFTGSWKEDRRLVLKGVQRLRDVDGDGQCEALTRREVYRWTEAGWEKAAELPWDVDSPALRFVDLNGDRKLDLVASDESGALVAVYEGPGWRVVKRDGVPMIARAGKDNGAWFHSGHLWVQNEDTATLKDLVDRRSFADLLRP